MKAKYIKPTTELVNVVLMGSILQGGAEIDVGSGTVPQLSKKNKIFDDSEQEGVQDFHYNLWKD